jgi:hypothetical protein
MSIRKRSAVLGIIAALSLIFYGAVKYNSYVLVEYVVEQTLIQKAPDGMNPAGIRERFRELLDSKGDRKARTDLLFEISGELEKVQVLTPQAMARLMEENEPGILIK